jgi:hypothetical protein
MNDAGDLVAGADVPQRRLVGDIGPLREHSPSGLAGQGLRQYRFAPLQEHTRLAHVEKCPGRVRPDEPQAASYQDHRASSSLAR